MVKLGLSQEVNLPVPFLRLLLIMRITFGLQIEMQGWCCRYPRL